MNNDTPFGPDYIWTDAAEYEQTMKRMSMTPYEMAREFRTVFGQPLDQPFDFGGLDTMALNLIHEEYEEVTEAHDHESEDDGAEPLLKELADLVYVVYGYAAFRGWNLDKALARVHLSNMTKIDPVTRTVIKREDGKVLKPPTYKPPYLKDLV